MQTAKQSQAKSVTLHVSFFYKNSGLFSMHDLKSTETSTTIYSEVPGHWSEDGHPWSSKQMLSSLPASCWVAARLLLLHYLTRLTKCELSYTPGKGLKCNTSNSFGNIA